MEYSVSKISTKANKTLGFLRRNLQLCLQYVKPQDEKEMTSKGVGATMSWNMLALFGTHMK